PQSYTLSLHDALPILLDNEKFIKKLERLDKLSLLNKKFSTIVMTQFIGLFLDLLKFGCAVALVFFLLTSELGRKFTAQSLTAVGDRKSTRLNSSHVKI